MRRFVLIFLYFLTIYCPKVRADCSNVVIVSEFDPYSCDRTKNEYFTESVDDTCIPGCVNKIGKIGSGIGACLEDSDCAPGLKCELGECIDDPDSETRCFWQKSTTSWTPNCLPDGSFAPVQCKGEEQNGRCFCFSKTGQRIFGEEWSSKAENMTCACSRQRSDLERGKNGRTDVSLHCDSMGNFEPLQCDSGACWCSDEKTGEVLVSVVPEEMMTILPCYKKAKVGDQYLRQCESQLLAQNLIRFEFTTHGTNNIKFPFVQCDYDGSYGRMKVLKSQVYCQWRDGTNLNNFADLNQMKYLNCYCARDQKIYEAAGKEHSKMCQSNGNYELLQPFDEKSFYCIDYDGFLTHGPEEDLKPEDCQQYLP